MPRPRALALALVAALSISITPARGAGADGATSAPAIAPLVAPLVARVVDSSSLAMSVAAQARPARRPSVAPPAAVFRDEDGDGRTDIAGTAVPAPTPRELIAARCPDLDDPKLLRDGADADGHGLCVRSVHGARTDMAAAAIVEGFGLLGLPYSRGRRGSDGYDDCSSFVGRSYRDAGRPLSDSDWEPSSSVMRNASWAHVVDEPKPGDILWRRGHVAMALADGYQMHASQSGDVTHVRHIGRHSRVLSVAPPV